MSQFFMRSETKQTYDVVDGGSEKSSDEITSFLGHSQNTPRRKSIVKFVAPWITTTLFFAALSIYLFISSRHSTRARGSFETGWNTDFEAAKSHISVEEVMFTGSPAFAKDGSFGVPHPGPISYVGDPSPAIDQAWEELTWGRYILISEQEAKNAFGGQYDDVKRFYNPGAGGYVAGLDMFHTLHCLNRIRKLFDPEYYPESDAMAHKIHRDHCIEQIRQYVMCAGDMTPIPTRFVPKIGHNYVDSDVRHTCRNFAQLRDWAGERFNGTSAVKAACPGKKTRKNGVDMCVL